MPVIAGIKTQRSKIERWQQRGRCVKQPSFALRCFGWTIVLTLYSLHGGNQHIGDVQTTGPDNLATVQLVNWLSQPFGIMGAAFGKVFVSALLLGIIGPAELQWQRYYICIVTIWLTMLVGISCSTLTFAQCSPAEALWDDHVDGKCLPPHIMAGYGQFAGSTYFVLADVRVPRRELCTQKTSLSLTAAPSHSLEHVCRRKPSLPASHHLLGPPVRQDEEVPA